MICFFPFGSKRDEVPPTLIPVVHKLEAGMDDQGEQMEGKLNGMNMSGKMNYRSLLMHLKLTGQVDFYRPTCCCMFV